jgi:uncharacterized paraquat-inducible protein A
MYGRYGNDQLTWVLLITGMILLLLGYIPRVGWIFSILALTVVFFSSFRGFSRNIPKRRRELERWLRIKSKPKKAIQLHKNKKRDKHTHLYFKCPKCRAVLRVPKGKGSIIVTCPQCNDRIEKTT